MERALEGQSWDRGDRSGDELDPRVVAEIVEETVEECERLILDAEHDAALLRRDAVRANADAERRAGDLVSSAEERARLVARGAESRLAEAVDQQAVADARLAAADARHKTAEARAAEAEGLIAEATVRMSRAAALHLQGSQAIATAAARAAELDARGQAVEERGSEVDRRFAQLWADSLAATVQARRTIEAAEEWASLHRSNAEERAGRCRSEAEDRATGLLDQAWRESTDLQQELMDEADAHALEITWQATLDAARIREGAEVDATALRAALAAPRPSPLEDDVASEAASASPAGRTRRARRLTFAAALVAVVLLGAMVVGSRLAAPHEVESESMTPALSDGERVLINKLVYDVRSPQRGDVVVIERTAERPDHALVKRVVGLPGETIGGRAGIVHVNGRALSEPYLEEDVVTPDFSSIELRDDEVFVLGDNRQASTDSREFGPVTTGEIVGRAEAVVWPIGDLHRL